jgi:membrane protease YdiL (CAAX protease family)
VIWGCLAVVAYANWRAARTAGRVEATEHFQLVLTSRIVLGEVRILPGSPELRARMKGQAIAQLTKLATEPGDKLRVAVVIGEVEGGKAALERLDSAAPQLKTPEGKADLATLRTIYTSGADAVPPAARDELIGHQGWFGKLALSFGRPDSDPLRAQVMRAAERAFVATLAVEGTATIAALVGLGLLIVAMIQLASGRIHLCYGRAPTLTTAFLESFALYLAGYVAIGLSARLLAPRVMYLGMLLSLLWMPIAMLWPLARGVSWAQLKGGLGWYVGRGVLREMGAGIVGYIAGLPLVVIAMIVSLILTTRTGSNASHPIMFGETHGVWPIVELYLLASVLAPLVEETMFRGALFTHLRQRHGWLLSAVVSAFIFAALHPQGWTFIPVLGTMGFVFAGIREWRGTFLASAAAHALNNWVMVTVLILAMR